MALKTVINKHSAMRDDMGDLITRRALPTSSIRMVDPFLFLNHHGPQIYPAGNTGLPFAPHPHRGFETVTFILKGDVAHRDSGGHESVIRAGGVQWMTAGSGLVHEEVSSDEFKKEGGELEILQLWVNLPKRLKMTQPGYRGLQENEIPTAWVDEGQVKIHVVSGEWAGVQGAFQPHYDVQLMWADLAKGANLNFSLESERNVFFYVIRGDISVNGEAAQSFELVELDDKGGEIEISAESDAVVLVGHAEPLREPVVSYGPFVMNSKAEILQAIDDYEAGLFE